MRASTRESIRTLSQRWARSDRYIGISDAERVALRLSVRDPRWRRRADRSGALTSVIIHRDDPIVLDHEFRRAEPKRVSGDVTRLAEDRSQAREFPAEKARALSFEFRRGCDGANAPRWQHPSVRLPLRLRALPLDGYPGQWRHPPR